MQPYIYCAAIYPKFRKNTTTTVCRDSSVGIATRTVNPDGGESFRTRPDQPEGPPSLQYNGYRVSFPGGKAPGCGVKHPPNTAPMLKKGWSYTSIPPLGLRGLFEGELYLLPRRRLCLTKERQQTVKRQYLI